MNRIRFVAAAAGALLAFFAFARDEDYEETSGFSKHVSVSFGATSAVVSNSAGGGVTYSQNGAALVFSNTVKHVAFTLTGASAAGSFKIYSEHPFKLTLGGVSLASPNGPAINIQSKKMCYVVMPAGSVSSLTDSATYSTQYNAANGVEDAKGVLFSEGQLIFSGEGALTVTGVCAGKHGLCSDDYIRVLGGDIRVAMTKKSDGVHVNERFRMDGGKLAIALALKGDGIDADDDGSIAIKGGEIAISLAAAESKGIKCGTNSFSVAGGAVCVTSSAVGCNALSGGGALALEGGLVSVALTGADCNAIKSDGAVTVSGGAVAVSVSGDQSKGIKTDGEAVINGGTLRFTVSGDAVLETVTNEAAFVYKDPSFCTGLKAGNVVVNAGALSVIASGVAGRGVSADGDITVNGGTITIAANGGVSAVFTNAENGVDLAAASCLKADRALTVNGGLLTLSVAGPGGKGLSAGSLLLNGGTFDFDLSGPAAFVNHGSYLEPVYCAGVKCDGNAVVSNGTFVIRHAGAAGRGFSVDTNLTIAGGSFAITTTGTNTAVYTSGVALVNGTLTNYLDVGAASAIKTDGNLVIEGGALDLLSTGCCGKGLNVGGALTLGTNAVAAAPSVTARTKGTQYRISGGTSSGGGGQPPGGGGGAPPDDSAEYSNPKAIKASGAVTINGGSVVVSTAASGGEGIESKDRITVNGGSIEATCYDDCMNAATNITVNGGTIYCSASNNDGMDSNGTLTLNGGIVASFGATAPEEGLDCDQNTFTVNGGTFVGCGGATSYPNAGSQYSLAYTGRLTSNTVLRITNTGGSSIFAFKMPRTYSSTVLLLCGCSGFASTGTYTVYSGASMAGRDFHGLYTNNVSSASGGTSKGSDSSATSRYYSVP